MIAPRLQEVAQTVAILVVPGTAIADLQEELANGGDCGRGQESLRNRRVNTQAVAACSFRS